MKEKRGNGEGVNLSMPPFPPSLHFISLSPFPYSLSISSQPGCQAASEVLIIFQVKILLERGSNVNQPDRRVSKSKICLLILHLITFLKFVILGRL